MLMDTLFGRYRQRVLGLLLLHPDTDYHVRELARLTGTTAGTLHKELARLAQAALQHEINPVIYSPLNSPAGFRRTTRSWAR